ncbi:mucin-17-like [Pecten maximus]|uniref:mucin-17-like n=1 Tax=Pecten maximus TaxID=6579 RepID=UPI0014583AC5|nr:mucin-17-like [Pecten maximus]
MASGSRAETDKSAIAAKLWAAARNTVDMLTNDESETAFSSVEDMLGKSSYDVSDDNDMEVETMDMGLKIDSVFTLPLDTYLEEKAEEPIEKLLRREQQTKFLESQCKPFSVVLQNIDHDLAGRHRVFYRQWKRRFDKCGESCRYKYIDSILRPRPKNPKKKRKPYTYKNGTRKSGSRSCLENVSQYSGEKNDTSHKENVVAVKQSSNKKPTQLRDSLRKKALSDREKLRYQYVNQMMRKDNSTKSYIMRYQFGNKHANTSADQVTRSPQICETKTTTNVTTASGKQCATETLRKMKVKIEPGLEMQNTTPEEKLSTFHNVKVKIEPTDETEANGYNVQDDSTMVSLLKKTSSSEEMKNYSTIKGILGTRKESGGDAQTKANLTIQSITDALKFKLKSSGSTDLTSGALKVSMPFAPYKSKRPVDSKPADKSKVFTSSAPQNQNFKTPTNNVPLLKNTSVLLTAANQVSSPQAPLQFLMTGVNSAGTQNQSQMILTGSNTTRTLNSPQLVMSGLNAPSGTQNPTQIVLAAANTTSTQNPAQLILTNTNQLTNTNMQQIVLPHANRPVTNQQLLLANNANGSTRLFLANTNSTLPVSQSTPNLVLTNNIRPQVSQSTPNLVLTNNNPPVTNSGQSQVLYANVYTNPNQTNVTGVLQTGQYVMDQIVQQLQQQPSMLNITSKPQVQPQTIAGPTVHTVTPPVQRTTFEPSSSSVVPQPVPVIQTSSVLPNSMSFPPGTLFFKRNSLPEAAPITGMQALSEIRTETQIKSTSAIGDNIQGSIDNSSVPVEGKTVTIGKQKYLLVPASSLKSYAQSMNDAIVNTENNDTKKRYDGFSSSSVSEKVNMLLERNDAIVNRTMISTSQSNKPTNSKVILPKLMSSDARKDSLTTVAARKDGHPKVEARKDGHPKVEARKDGHPKVEARKDGPPKVEARKDGPPKVEARKDRLLTEEDRKDRPLTVREALQNKARPRQIAQTFVSNDKTDNDDDVIYIDDPDAVPVVITIPHTSANSRKRNPRKSKPQPRLDYDEFLKLQKSRPIVSSGDDSCTDTEVDIETVDTVPGMAGKGMLIPRTPTMPKGVREWPDGATISEKSITLPSNMLENIDESAW